MRVGPAAISSAAGLSLGKPRHRTRRPCPGGVRRRSGTGPRRWRRWLRPWGRRWPGPGPGPAPPPGTARRSPRPRGGSLPARRSPGSGSGWSGRAAAPPGRSRGRERGPRRAATTARRWRSQRSPATPLIRGSVADDDRVDRGPTAPGGDVPDLRAADAQGERPLPLAGAVLRRDTSRQPQGRPRTAPPRRAAPHRRPALPRGGSAATAASAHPADAFSTGCEGG